MTTREDRDKAKSAREMLSKYFFSLSIATYTGAVMGTLASMLGLLKGIDLDFGVVPNSGCLEHLRFSYIYGFALFPFS